MQEVNVPPDSRVIFRIKGAVSRIAVRNFFQSLRQQAENDLIVVPDFVEIVVVKKEDLLDYQFSYGDEYNGQKI